jgi:RNA polymerase sigma-70 factor (ECF subfamily)
LIRVAPSLSLPDGVDVARPDASLLEDFARGDTLALGELFDRHHAAVYRFVARLTSTDRADLDDLVQQTFVEVARRASTFRGASAVRSWLFGIAVNVARHDARSRTRRRRVIGDFGGERPSQVPGVDRPDETAERNELLERLARAIDALPLPLREVFVACEVEDLAGAEVARQLGIPEGTLWRRLHEARKKVRALVEGDPT